MPFYRCEREDPWVRMVRESYAATVVRTPRVGLAPLTVLCRKGDDVQERGALAPLLLDATGLQLPPVRTEQASALSGSRTSSIDSGLGARVSTALLTGLGVPLPGGAGLESSWREARAFSFEVREVQSRRVDVNALGAALKGRVLDKDNPAAAMYFPSAGNEPEAVPCVVTRALVSSELVIRATTSSGQALQLSAGDEALVGGSGRVSCAVEQDGGVVFRGVKPATFALSAVPLNVRPDGTFTFGIEIRGSTYLEGHDQSQAGPAVLAMDLPVVDEDGLLELG